MKRKWLYILVFLPAFSSCLESPEMTTGIVNGKEKPTVRTVKTNPFPNDDGNLFFQGEVTSTGKAKTTERGFFWSTVSKDSVINGKKIASHTNSDIFTCELKGASGGKTYYWRAYAENSYGYDYGEVDSCKTPAIWVEKSYFSSIQGKGVIFILNKTIYMTCGEYNGGREPTNEIWEYSIEHNHWNRDIDRRFPGNYRINPVVFTIGDLAFVGTGRYVGIEKDFYQYNGVSNLWTEIAVPDDLEARYEAVAFSLNGKGYLVGGFSAGRNALDDVWQYDPENGSWERKNNFPVNFYGGISISDNNRAFAGLSYVASEYARILWEYNEETDSWDEFAILPDELAIYDTAISGVIVQNFIYIVDGNNIIWALNMNDKTWKEKTNLPSIFPKKFQTLITTGNSNSVYVGLGFSNYLYEYHPLWDN